MVCTADAGTLAAVFAASLPPPNLLTEEEALITRSPNTVTNTYTLTHAHTHSHILSLSLCGGGGRQQPTTPVIEKLLRLGNHDADAPEGKKKGGSFAGANQNTRAVEGKDKDGVLQPHQQQNEARSPARGGGPRTKASSRRRDAHSDTRANEEKATSKREAEGAGPHSAPSPHLRDRHESEDGTVSGADASDVSGCVMLFCRHPGQDYVCLGRLQREKTDLSARPMRVLWRLRDHAALRKHSSAFRAMFCVDDTAAP